MEILSIPKKKKSDLPNLGRLKDLGIKDEYLLPFLFPREYNDIRIENIIQDFRHLQNQIGNTVYIGGALHGKPFFRSELPDRNKPAMTKFTVKDKRNQIIEATVFGKSMDLANKLQAHKSFCLRANIGEWNGDLHLNNVEWVDSRWIGKFQPVYPGKAKRIGPETVLVRMMQLVGPHTEKAVNFLREKFSLNNEQDEKELIESLGIDAYPNLASVIKSIHAPITREDGEQAQVVLKRLAALEVVDRLNKTASVINEGSALPITYDMIKRVIADMPVGITLTRDQRQAIKEIVDDIRSNKPMDRLLNGDVGTGKTMPIGVVATAVARLGHNVVILMPNPPLAEQLRQDIETWWPDTQPKLVTGNIKGLPDSRILVGTTALNFRVPKDYPRKLLIIDEQQKMSVEQRRALAQDDTNVLEASATPLPRSLALIKYGGISISTLKEAYVKKEISTQIVFNQPQQRKNLFEDVKKTIYEGYQALIIYPLAETAEVTDDVSEKAKKNDLKSAEGAFEVWEKHYPGRVRFVHGRMKEEKFANINAMKNNEADILCSTTVVEVGLNLARLRYVVIVHPERLGLSTLHQIRGRLCRNGGTGKCALYLPEKISEKSMARLKVIERTIDGFEIAAEDMRLRGIGDINHSSEDEQSGQVDISFLPSQKLDVEDFEWAANSKNRSAAPSMR